MKGEGNQSSPYELFDDGLECEERGTVPPPSSCSEAEPSKKRKGKGKEVEVESPGPVRSGQRATR